MFLFAFAILNIILLNCVPTHAKSINEGDSPEGPGDISRRMCEKYSKYVESDDCPFNPSATFFDGGINAGRKEFPHMLMLGYNVSGKIQWSCGGSLISEQYVLTVAHCSNNHYVGNPVVVKIGVTNLEDTHNLQEIKVKEINVHPLYKAPAAYNDIGLIKLEKKVNINQFARPACLNTRKDINISKAIISGWSLPTNGNAFDNNLQKLIANLYSQEKCNEVYRDVGSKKLPSGITFDTMLCPGPTSETVVQPMSGSILQLYHTTGNGANTCMYDIIGLASFGKSRISTNQPDVYTRISAYTSWIEETVWSDELK